MTSRLSKKTPRHANARDLELGRSDEPSREDGQLLAALAPMHPRHFWQAAKPILAGRLRDGEGTHLALEAFEGRPALIRAGLSLASRQSRVDGVGRNVVLASMLAMAMSMPGRRPEFYQARARDAAQAFSKLSASEAYRAIAAPASAGNAHGTLALARLMPDSKSQDKEEARRFTYGETSFVDRGMHDLEARAWAIAACHAEAHGMPAPAAPPGPQGRCDNAFFWIAHRHREALGAGLPEAALWAQAGTILVERVARLSESGALLALALGTEPLRKALMAARPLLASPRMWRRDAELLGAFQMARPDEVAEIAAYVDTGPAPRLMPASDDPQSPSPARYANGLPTWALALLAGHAPSEDWMPAPGSEHAQGAFKLPRALVAKAADGSLSPADLAFHGDSGAALDAAKLCRALGRPWGAAKPSRKAPLPKSKAIP